MQSAPYAIAHTSVRPLHHGWISQKRLKLGAYIYSDSYLVLDVDVVLAVFYLIGHVKIYMM